MAAAPVFIILYNLIFSGICFKVPNLTDFTLLFLVVFLYPLVEELAFRGMIQEYLTSKTQSLYIGPLTFANLLTSMLFTLLHFIYNPVFTVMLVFIPSLLFGYFKEKYNTLLASIILHMFYNLCSLFIVKSPFVQ